VNPGGSASSRFSLGRLGDSFQLILKQFFRGGVRARREALIIELDAEIKCLGIHDGRARIARRVGELADQFVSRKEGMDRAYRGGNEGRLIR